ncbi:hypothetical protein EDC04DRAFT_2607279 [Pisolithus marmoratus]|nr:hypothetical protein EDC04DRAFT_2607279 [Pisolithus marmoratus]
MSNQAFHLTPRMINKEAFCLLSQYATQVISLEHAMDEIQYVLGSDFDEDEWMDVTQCIIMDPLCFADMEKVFMERLAEKESSNATGPAHLSDEATQQWKDHEGEVGTSGKKVEGWYGKHISGFFAQRSFCMASYDGLGPGQIRYPNLDNKLRGFGLRYIHEEWQPLISTIFGQSDPSNEEPQPPTSLVEEAMRAYGISFVTHADLVPTVPTSQPNPPRSTVQCSSGKAPQNSKHRKMGISQFLDLAAKEDDSEDNYADEDIDETQGNAGCPMDAGPAGKSSFSHAIDVSAQSFMYEYMKSNGIDKGPYKGDISFVERSYPTNVILIVAPHEHPYDLPEQCGEKSLFSSELATTVGLALVLILSSTGVDIGFTCGGYDFIHGLLHLTIPTDLVILVKLPHPNDIAFHMIADFKWSFMEETVLLFSTQFWHEFNTVEIWSRELSGSQGRLIDVEWHKRTASLFLPTNERLEGNVNATGETIHCAIQELHRVFNMGQAVRFILEVSDLLLEAHMPDHVHSLTTGHADTHIHLPKPADVVLPGDTVNVSQGAYKGAEAPIEWMSVDSTQAWIYVKETKYSSSQTGIHSTQGEDPDQQAQYSSAQTDVDDTLGMHPDWLVGYIMVPVNVHDVQVHWAAQMLAFSKEKGFNICVGDNVEVARGKWFQSRGMVQTVHFDNAYLDFVCDTYGQKISVPITFCCKVAEHLGLQLSQWIGWDIWVIRGEKKGYQGMLRTLGRDISCVALQGWLIQLKNDYIATP